MIEFILSTFRRYLIFTTLLQWKTKVKKIISKQFCLRLLHVIFQIISVLYKSVYFKLYIIKSYDKTRKYKYFVLDTRHAIYGGPGGSISQVVGSNSSFKPITNTRGFAPSFVNYKKGCTRLAAASDQAYQLFAHVWWFSPGTLVSSTTKTGRHDIAEILLKVALKKINKINQSKSPVYLTNCYSVFVQCTPCFITRMHNIM